MMKKTFVWLAVAGLVLGVAATAGAGGRQVIADGRWTQQDVSPKMLQPLVWEYTGRILDSYGNPITGKKDMAVQLYDAEAGGNLLWKRVAPVNVDASGTFSVRLMDSLEAPEGAPESSLTDALASGPVWIECSLQEYDDDDPLLPIAAVAANPYALFADEAAGSRGDFDVAGSLRAIGTTQAQNMDARDVTSAGAVDVANQLHATGNVSLAGGLQAGALSGIGAVPVGTIILWHGNAASVPLGWALCDGTDGRPDMRGRFPVGAGNQYRPWDTGGAESVTLSVDELPSHSHGDELRDDNNRDLAHGADRNDGVWHGDTGATSGSAGGDDDGNTQPHENRPPFKTIHFIMRVS